jgi:hypothetical protein
MARGASTTVARAGAHNIITTASPSPSLVPQFDGANLMVSLREMKAMAQGLDPSHPFRILLLGEPDEIPRHEYASKVVGWFRLIVTPAGSVRLDDR